MISSPKEQFLAVLKKECVTTLKVMRAYPAGKPGSGVSFFVNP